MPKFRIERKGETIQLFVAYPKSKIHEDRLDLTEDEARQLMLELGNKCMDLRVERHVKAKSLVPYAASAQEVRRQAEKVVVTQPPKKQQINSPSIRQPVGKRFDTKPKRK